jgi:two-component system CheB/CheR fusion protein
MVRMIDDLLDVTRIAQGKLSLQREPLDLCEIIQTVSQDHEQVAAEKSCKILVHRNVPQLIVYGDRTRLAEALTNLLQNAVKFSSFHSMIEIYCDLAPERKEALIKIQDYGQGICPALIPQLFEPFVQAENTLERRKGGVGLGLVLVKGLIELHGGTVSAASEGLGKGATFTIRLPTTSSSMCQPHVPPVFLGAQQTKRVLIIEDNIDIIEALCLIIRSRGHKVVAATSGLEGLALAEEFKPDIVLCDIGIPELSGYEVATRMRATPKLRKVYLVAVSGYGMPRNIALAQEHGFDKYIIKPIRAEQLDEILAMR